MLPWYPLGPIEPVIVVEMVWLHTSRGLMMGFSTVSLKKNGITCCSLRPRGSRWSRWSAVNSSCLTKRNRCLNHPISRLILFHISISPAGPAHHIIKAVFPVVQHWGLTLIAAKAESCTAETEFPINYLLIAPVCFIRSDVSIWLKGEKSINLVYNQRFSVKCWQMFL